MRASCVCVADWQLRKHKRTPSDTDNHCSKARHRAAIFVLMTSLPSLLVPVFMCWLGYSIEPASDLQGCVCRGWGGGALFSFVAANVLASVLTKPSANLCSRFQVGIYLFSLCLSFSLSQFVFTTMHPFALAYQLTGFTGTPLLHSPSLPLTQITS